MRRREFIGLLSGAAAWPFAAAAQAPERIVTIGYLSSAYARLWAAANGHAFREGLRDLGYIEGKNLRFELRFAEGDESRLPALARELVALEVDVIVTSGLGVYPARQATSTIPIVQAAGGDIVASGLVASLAHPGGNVTGSTFFYSELMVKRLQMLKDIAPSLERVGLLVGKAPSPEEYSYYDNKFIRAHAEPLKIELFAIEANGPEDFESAFATCDERRIGGLAVADSPHWATGSAAGAIAVLAAARRLPTVGPLELVENGGLVGYGVDFAVMFRRAAYFVDKILKGASPGDIPIEQATKFITIVNLKTAKAIGVEIPPLLLAGADEVIE
jgi:putative tryptophan/tyrosine transport system substrate-binding protein